LTKEFRMRTTFFAASLLVAVAGCTVPTSEGSEDLAENAEAVTGGTTYFMKLPLMSGDTGNCMNVAGASTSAGANIQEWDCNGASNEKFTAVDISSWGSAYAGYFELKNTNSGLCVEIYGAVNANGTNIDQWGCKTSTSGSRDNQAWKFESINGYYRIRSKLNTGDGAARCVDVQGGTSATANGTNIALWSCGTGGNQTWNPASTSGGGTSGIAGVISQSTFDSWFPNKVSLYTYSGFTSMNSKYSDIANQSDTTLRKREVAAMLANFAHETGDFVYARETCWDGVDSDGQCKNWGYYCSGCGASCPNKKYYGRGWTQLSWPCNYQAAGNALGYDLFNNPDWVATNANISAQSAAWYWRTQPGPGGYGNNSHDAMNASSGSGGFGETIKHTNGSLECPSLGGTNTAQRDARISRYKTYCDRLGVSYGNNLSC